jgi:cytosine/uracil/thiamine/allantoin permease
MSQYAASIVKIMLCALFTVKRQWYMCSTAFNERQGDNCVVAGVQVDAGFQLSVGF